MGIPIIDEKSSLRRTTEITPKVEVAPGIFVSKSDVHAYHRAQAQKEDQSKEKGYACPMAVAQHRKNTARTTIGSAHYPNH